MIVNILSKEKINARIKRRKTINANFTPYDYSIENEDVETPHTAAELTIQRGILNRWYYLFTMQQVGRTIIVIGITITLLYIYMISVHRVKGLKELGIVLETMSKPLYNSRCRQHNETYYQCLPNVFLIGASKCGTTTLVDYLKEYPNIGFVKRRIVPDKHTEVHRFDRNTYGWALKEIDLADEWASSPLFTDPTIPIIHYTPHYLYAPTVPYEMKEFYPDPDKLKFIVMLRNPIDRAISSYWFQNSHLFHDNDQGSIDEFQKLVHKEMSERNKYETCMEETSKKANELNNNGIVLYIARKLKSLASFIVNCIFHAAAIISSSKSLSTNQTNTSNYAQNHNSKSYYKALQLCYGDELRSPDLGHRHIDKGIYVDQIHRWWDNFPSKNFYFILFDKFIENPRDEFRKLLDFINDDQLYEKNKPSNEHNMNNDTNIRTKRIEKRQHMLEITDKMKFDKRRLFKPNSLSENSTLPSSFIKTLENYYKPYNDELEKLLNIKLYN